MEGNDRNPAARETLRRAWPGRMSAAQPLSGKGSELCRCRRCFHLNVIPNLQIMQGITGFYCKGCGSIIHKDGTPLKPLPST